MFSDSKSGGMEIYLRTGELFLPMTHFLKGEENMRYQTGEINKTETKFKQIHFNPGMLKINTEVLNY